MKKTVAAWAVLLALMQPAAALCLATGEDLEVGAAAAIVMEAETGEVLFRRTSTGSCPWPAPPRS